MSKVLLPQKAQKQQQHQRQQQKQENSTITTIITNPKIMMASSTQLKLSKEKQNLPNNFTTPKQTTTGDSDKESTPDSPTRTIDFDDFTSTSSIMEFLKQEHKCVAPGELGNGHDSDIDAESIFQEVSRLADNSDTRSVDELLREAELLLQHHNFLDSFVPNQKKKSLKSKEEIFKVKSQSTIQMNSKYTKSIENVKPRNAANTKLINGYTTCQNEKISPKAPFTPETPTPTNPLSSNTFNAFVDNLPSESVISEESVPVDLHANTTASVKSSSSSNNTTGKDITTKQMDGDDTDEGTDTIEEITEAMETIELIVHDNDEEDDNDVNANDILDGEGNNDDNTYTKDIKTKRSNELLTLALASDTINLSNSTYSSLSSSVISTRTNLVQHNQQQQQQHNVSQTLNEYELGRRPSYDVTTYNINTSSMAQQHIEQQQQKQTVSSPNLLASPLLRLAMNAPPERCNSGSYIGRRSSITTPDSGVSSQTNNTTASTFTPTHSFAAPRPSSPTVKSIGIGTITRSFCDKSVNSSPVHMVSTLTSPIDTHNSLASITREHALKQEIEQLQERLKDTEERLESFRIQHDTVSQLHRKLRESNTQLQEESEMLKLDVQHLNECANVLRTELQAARHDRDEALDLQKVLQNELEETRAEKKRAQEQKERDAKTIQDLQRQCREMERILMRKHPDSVSALIVASKSGSGNHNNDQENHSSRKLLEQRIAQLESDAKDQDLKAQQILANVQARFNSVQAKYETHIADLETQVLSLQEINTKLNEKIESQVRTLDYFVSKKAERFYNNCTQTEEAYLMPIPTPTPPTPAPAPLIVAPEPKPSRTTHQRKTISTQTVSATKESGTNTIGTSSQHSASSSTSSTANSTPNNSRPNSKQSGIRKPMATASSLSSAVASKLPISQSDSTISMSAAHAAASAKEDAHLLATIRGMRVDLAIKNKALQRLTRELDECKKTIRKIQKEKEAFKNERSQHSTAASSSSSKTNVEHMPASTESQALKEALNKYKLLEADYKQLHEKRLQDLKTLQTAHERELATCHETVRILQQRLNERDEQFALQKRRKVPVDYYALKAKVSSLERRHTEREERLHMLVEALSKGRLNGALDEILGDNNNQ